MALSGQACFAVSSPAPEDVPLARILHISDPHVLPEGERAYGVVDTATALRHVVRQVNAALPRIGPIDLAVVTGDLTDHGTAQEYALFRQIMSGLTLDYVAIPGNHDSRPEMRAAFAGASWMPDVGEIRWRVDLEGLCVIGLDTHVPRAPHGALSAEALLWLEREIATLGARPLIVALHHPPVATGLTQMDRQGLADPEPLNRILAGHPGPCRIIAGHVHRMVLDTLGPTPVIIAPGTSHAVTLDLRAARAGTFDMEPGGVLIHDAGQTIRTHLMPIGDFAGPHPFAGRP
jgi:3',5'-cyclic AMP phosphodiesterase CpdA